MISKNGINDKMKNLNKLYDSIFPGAEYIIDAFIDIFD